jgi:predicted PurR-regulated permease PerM
MPPDHDHDKPRRRDSKTERRSRVGGWPIFIVGLFLLVLTYELRYTLIPFVFAIVIGFVLDPVIAWSAKRMRGHRWPMATLLTVLIIGFVSYGVYWVGNQAFRDLTSAMQKLPQMIESGIKAISGPQGIELFGAHYTPEQLTHTAIQSATNLFSSAQIALALQVGVGAIAAVILTFVLIPYFLVSGPRIASGTLWLVPPERRGSIEAMLPELVPVLRRYVVGIICVVVYTAIAAYIGFGVIFSLPGAALISVVVGVLEMIPVVGPVTSIVLVSLASLQGSGLSVIWPIAWALGLRILTDNVVGPFLLGKAVTLHPVVVIFAFVVGAMLFGIIGLLLAVPTSACVLIILQYYYAEPIAPGGAAEPEPVRVTAQLDTAGARPR